MEDAIVEVDTNPIFKTPVSKSTHSRSPESSGTPIGSFSERVATYVMRDGACNFVSNSSPDTCAFRVRLLCNSTCTYGDDRWKVNNNLKRWSPAEKLRLLVHRSCSNTSEEVNASSASSLSLSSSSKAVPPKKCFPASPKILYNHTITCGSMEVAVNYFRDNDPKITFFLCGKLNRYDNLSNFHGTLFTTAPLSMFRNWILVIYSTV